jgi:cell division septation protein DedD
LARNDEGEFELILGNRQLVSVFLIVVILLGVFFSMGYIVGRNNSPTTIVADGHTAGSGKPIVVDNTQHPAAPLPEEPASSPSATTPVAATPVEQAPPAPVVEKPSPVKGSTPAEKKPEEAKRVEPKPAPPPEAAKRTAVGEPPPGVYLQVVATVRADAEIISESLLKKGFRSMVAPVPDQPNLNRVVVGPYKDAGDMAEGRLRLEAIGFKPYVRKY